MHVHTYVCIFYTFIILLFLKKIRLACLLFKLLIVFRKMQAVKSKKNFFYICSL